MIRSEISQCVDRSLRSQTEVVRRVSRAFPWLISNPQLQSLVRHKSKGVQKSQGLLKFQKKVFIMELKDDYSSITGF